MSENAQHPQTASFGDAPDDASPTASTPPEPTGKEGRFGPSLAVAHQSAVSADYVTIKFADIVDVSGSKAKVKFTALLDGKVVNTANVNLREGGPQFKYDPDEAFDEVRVQAAESDVTGKVVNVNWAPLPETPSEEPEPEPEPPAEQGSFGPSQAVTYEVDPGRLADSVTITLDVEEERGSIAKILLEALLDGQVVGTTTRYVREPGGEIEYNPREDIDGFRIRAGESDVTGLVKDVKWTLQPEPGPGSEPPTLHEFEERVFELTNAERVKRGIAPLKSNDELNEAADRHAEDMAANDYFSHTGLDGDRPWDRAEEVGYSSRGFAENIARGQRSPEQVVDAWMNSSGHRKNILNSAYKDIGVGYEEEDDVWVQKFGTGDTNPDSFLV